MSPRNISRWLGFVVLWAILHPLLAPGRPEPQGLIVYRQPLTTFTEVVEYQVYRQENALYVSLVTVAGERKQLKAGGVLAVLPYPPASFDADFASTALMALARIDSLAKANPAVQSPLEKVHGKWARALSVFQQQAPGSTATPAAARLSTFRLGGDVWQDVRLTSANIQTVTLTHAGGVVTIPAAELSTGQSWN